MRNFFVYFSLIFTCISNCFATDYSSWYTKKPKDNILYLYSIGIGKSKEEAIRKALIDISNILLTEKQFGDLFFIENPSDIKEPIFSIYSIEKEDVIKGEYYVLISIKRNEIYSYQLEHFNDINSTINTKYEFINDKNIFSKIEVYKDILKLAEEAKKKITILKNIDSFNDKEYLNRYRDIEEEYNSLKNEIDISIVADDEYSSKILKLIEEYCNEKNIKINPDSSNVLTISSDIKKEKVYNNYMVNVNFEFKLRYNDNIIGYNSVSLTSNSKKGFGDSMRLIIRDFEKNILTYKIIY